MVHQTMQAIRVHRYGGPEQLRLERVPRPRAGAGEVLVRLYAVGVLPAEWKVRDGFFQGVFPVSFPYIPGSAFAGLVEAVGHGVTAYQPGQAVFGRTANGAYAEYTTVSVETVAVKPDSLSFAEAATISGGATVAWSALFENGALEAGQRVLIHGAAGGVGHYAVQFARAAGAQVIGTVSTANVEFARALGVETVIDYTTTPFEEVARDVDMVLDTIGGDTLRRSMHVLRPGGILVSLLEAPPQTLAQQLGIRAMKNDPSLPFPSSSLLQSIAGLIEAGELHPFVSQTFALQEAREAHERSQAGHGRGRIVLRIVDEPDVA